MFSEIASSFGLSRLQVALQEKKPIHVIQSIVKSFPESIKRPDLGGLLPLHYAARLNASPEVVLLLACAHPEALEMADYQGWLPLHYAARKGKSEEVVRMLVEACPRTLFAKENSGKLPADVVRQKKSAVATFLRKAMIDAERMPAQELTVSVIATPTEIDLDDYVPAGGGTPAPAVPPSHNHGPDRDRVRRAVEHPRHEPPALVSVAYVESIQTQTFLGDGFFGTVYKGSDPVLGREFAIKSINTEILRGGTKQELEDAMRTFKTEQVVRT
jgi:hypothetical protein